MPSYLLLPFLAAWVFALSGLYFKRAFDEGAGVVSTLAATNLAMGLGFSWLVFLEPQPILCGLWWQPFVVGSAFFLGQLANFAALRLGDVSLVTPLMGSKLVLVAGLEILLAHSPARPAVLVAAVLTSIGILIMGLGNWRSSRRLGLTIVLTLACAFGYAVCDVLIHKWAKDFGSWNFSWVNLRDSRG